MEAVCKNHQLLLQPPRTASHLLHRYNEPQVNEPKKRKVLSEMLKMGEKDRKRQDDGF